MGAIKTETVVSSFKKCGISNTLNGSEDDVLYDDSDSSISDSSSDDQNERDAELSSVEDDDRSDEILEFED